MESLFQALANAADGAFVIDDNQRIIYWNRAAQEILESGGVGRQRAINLSPSLLRGRYRRHR
jgi:PAS domain S-box-containing protein